MVHRAPDSRLLVNVIRSEKEYVKHLAGVGPLSHTALAALSAYAAAAPASPTSPARTIAAVIDVLAAADDALQRYSLAVDTWRAQLAALSDLETDLAAVLRDRDILVTRLIKASKSTRDAHRSSRLISPPLGSSSLSSLNSSPGSAPASTNPKLAQAQAELQACEAQLVVKERELDAARISVARDGLGVRCRALIDCGWVWGEMGKQGIKALQALSAVDEPAPTVTVPNILPSPPPPTKPTYTSDNSSVTPSQSASQAATRSGESHDHAKFSLDGDITIKLPPAHSISELALPQGVRVPTPPNPPKPPSSEDSVIRPAPRRKAAKPTRRPPSHYIPEVSDEDGPTSNSHASAPATVIPRAPFPSTPPDSETHDDESSSDNAQPIGPFEVVENDPFDAIRRSMISPSVSALFDARAPPASMIPPIARASAPDVRSGTTDTSPFKAVFPTPGPGTTPASVPTKRERRTSMAFFGSLKGLFRKPKARAKLKPEWDGRPQSPSSPSHTSPSRPTPRARANGWVTRVDTRIKSSGENSDDEPADRGRAMTPVARANSGARLRKGRPGAPTRGTQGAVSSPSVPLASRVGVSMDGWITDGPVDPGANAKIGPGGGENGDANAGISRSRARRATAKRRKTSVADLRGSDQGHTDGEVDDSAVRPPPLQRASNKHAKSSERSALASASEHSADVQEKKGEEKEKERSHKGSILRNAMPAGDKTTAHNATGQPRRATTAIANRIRKPSNGHRRSASLSAVVMSPSQSPPQSPPPSQSPSRAPSPDSQTRPPVQADKPNGRRQLTNGHTKTPQAPSPNLMSIVADVTRRREADEDTARPGSLDVQRDPRAALGLGTANGHVRSSSSPTARAMKTPLRSVLRNASRTPSPSPASTTASAPVSRAGTPTIARLVALNEQRREAKEGGSPRDSASASSYETGRESLELPSAPTSRPISFSIPPPPVSDPPLALDETSAGAEPPSGERPVRRKSVRVSLQPTYSPTPPAMYDENGESCAPWSASFDDKKGSREKAADVWADSSEEDEVYRQARRLLGSVGDKGKARA